MSTRLRIQAKITSMPVPSFTPLQSGLLQRRSTNQIEPDMVPRVVHETLRCPGQPLNAETRTLMESRFDHDFSQVRVHTGTEAAESAQAVNASAYTVGQHIVFGGGHYAPATSAGEQLLAHELTHVLQQEKNGTRDLGGALRLGSSSSAAEQEARQSAARILAGAAASPRASAAPGMLQRENGGGGGNGGDEEEYRLRWPGMSQGPFSRLRLAPELELRLDPEIQAQIDAMRIVRETLDLDSIRSSLLRVDFGTLLATQPPPWLTAPPTPTPAPLVPRGAGPSTPRAATGGDVARAIMRIPAVDSALTRLRTEAAEQARRDWRRLSTGERALVITQSALIAGGALAGVLSSPEGREFSLNLLQNRAIPIPGVPGLTFQFNVTGPNQMVRFDLNVGALLPRSLGFR